MIAKVSLEIGINVAASLKYSRVARKLYALDALKR